MGGGIVRHEEGFRHLGPGGGPLDDQLPRTHASRMGNRTRRYAALVERLVDSVLATSGHTTSKLRHAAFARAFGPHPRGEDIAPDLARYVAKVALPAYKATDAGPVPLQRA